MKSFLQAAKKYYVVTSAVIVGILGLALYFGGQQEAAKWFITVFCAVVAAKVVWDMVQELQEGHYGIDILAFLAIVSTLVVGEYWASIVIVLMLMGGEALEDFAQGRAQRELTALLAREPQIAHRESDGKTEDVAITNIAIGDTLLVKPHEIIPVDGILLSESASIDESSITGESLPRDHAKGETLMSGAVNTEQAIRIQAVHTAHDSQYQRIIELVKSASSTEAPFVRLADRYAIPFTIISLFIAVGAWIVTGLPIRFVEVLVVATPCPLLLGAPIAMISGMSRAAKQGIIVKNGATLEKLARIRTVAFDKTGTLTSGVPVVKEIFSDNGLSQETLLKYAASAEQQSTHVLALALQDEAKKRNMQLLTPQNVKEVTAQGVVAELEGKPLQVGKFAFLHAHGIEVKEHAKKSGETAIYVAYEGKYVGSITFQDEVRENSKSTLERFRKLGVLQSLMVTGDAHGTAERIAEELGLSDVRAELLPEDKVNVIRSLKERPVLMVGDGVNDAPVLAAADVGMAMGAKGATAASETADAVILVDDIARSAESVFIAKNTMRIALQSVWTGIAISVGLMIIAALGVIPAVVGAALQEVVDVVVIINALRAHGPWGNKQLPVRTR